MTIISWSLNVIKYFEDGERVETPKYGLDHYKNIEATPEDLSKYCENAKGVYVFKNANIEFWDKILILKKTYGFKLMWEIGSDATTIENYEIVKNIASEVDVFSLNLSEARNMMNLKDIDEILNILLRFKTPFILLRAGSKGTYAIYNGKYCLIPSIKDIKVVDVTGGGNSSSGGAFIGYCETGNGFLAAKMGNISASFSIAQYGVPEFIDEKMRNKAYELLGGTYFEKR